MHVHAGVMWQKAFPFLLSKKKKKKKNSAITNIDIKLSLRLVMKVMALINEVMLEMGMMTFIYYDK